MAGIRSSKYFAFSFKPIFTFRLLLITMLCVGSLGVAQQPTGGSDPLPSAPQAQPGAENTRIVIPAGTRIDLVLTQPLDSNAVRKGDSLFAQTTAPVLVNDQVAIPAGAFIRGKVDNLRRNGTRGELLMQSASLVIGGSVIPMGGPVNIESENWTAWNNPTGHSKAAIILVPMLAMPAGLLIGRAFDGHKTTTLGSMTITTPTHTGLAVGAGVGAGVGFGTALALMAHSHQFYLEDGSPMHMTLANPVSITREQVSEGTLDTAPIAAVHPAALFAQKSWIGTGTCYTPGTPGIPGITIPATPHSCP